MKTRWREIPTWRSSGEPGLLDEGDHFDESTGRFTAPSSGYYHVSADMRMDGPLGFRLEKNILSSLKLSDDLSVKTTARFFFGV